MKYRFLLLSTLLASASVFAQSSYKKVQAPAETDMTLTPGSAPVYINEGQPSPLTEEEGPILFYSDFNDSTAQWTNASQNSSAAVWEWRGPNTTPSVATGSQGAYAGGSGVIESATPSNGFMIFDSDYYDNGGTAGNFGLGPFPAPHDAALTSPEIDCSAENGVLLSFHSYYRQYDANGWVIISTDNFATADTVYNASDFHDVNDAGPADEVVRLNISETAAGSSTLKVRFVFNGRNNATPTGYYFWQIDDVKVTGASDFDISVSDTYFKGAGVGNKKTLFSNFYPLFPQSQASATNLKFGALIENLSDGTASGVQLNASVTGSGTFSSSSTGATYSTFGAVDSINVSDAFTPSAVGLYTVDLEVTLDSADDFPGDNSVTREFEVTDRTWSWGDGTADNAWSWSSGSHSIFSLYDFVTDDTVTAIEIGIYSSSTFASDDGAVVEVGIWEADWETDSSNIQLGTPVGAPKFRVMTSSEYITSVPTSSPNLIRVAFDNPVAVPAGQYLIGYKRSSGTIRTASSPAPTVIATWLDFDSDGVIDGWTDINPLIFVETWSQDICAGTDIIVDSTITCNLGDYTADIDVTVFNGEEPYSYEWSTGSTDEDITVDAEGQYVLTITDANFCTKTAAINVENGSIFCNLAVSDIEKNGFDFTVLPNPNNGQFNIAFDALKSERVNLEIQSLKGDIIFTDAFNITNGTTKSIDLNGLAAGVYVMKVSSETATSFEKIIIE